MKALFIIPCAIMIGEEHEGHFERFFQLQHTIDSILSRFKNPEIRIYELSGKNVYSLFKKQLPEHCTLITTESDSEVLNIKEGAKDVRLPVSEKIRPVYEKSYIKNATESMILYRVLSNINPKEYDRIFKITGRYFFNHMFDLDVHNIDGKITLKNKSKCNHGKKYTKTDHLRHCMYWSYCTSIHDVILDNFKKIHEYIVDHSNGKGIASIENGLELFFDSNIINSIESTGVSGRIDGQYFYID